MIIQPSQKILRTAAKTIVNYKLIEPDDNILVGFSGGKDSWTLLSVLKELQKNAPLSFKFSALHINPLFIAIPKETLTKTVGEYCRLEIMDVPFEKIIHEHDNQTGNFCSFCARLRRGYIYTYAKNNGFNKVALAHHLDDSLETLLINLFYSGQLKAMPPVYQSQRKDFMILSSGCPFLKNKPGKRVELKELIKQLARTNPDLRKNMLHALKNIKKDFLF